MTKNPLRTAALIALAYVIVVAICIGAHAGVGTITQTTAQIQYGDCRSDHGGAPVTTATGRTIGLRNYVIKVDGSEWVEVPATAVSQDAQGIATWDGIDEVITGLLPSTTYSVTALCRDEYPTITTAGACGQTWDGTRCYQDGAESAATIVATLDLEPPTGLTIDTLAKTASSVTLNWTAPVNAEGCTDYVIFQDQEISQVVDCATTTAAMSSLQPLQGYQWRVEAYNTTNAAMSDGVMANAIPENVVTGTACE